MTFYLGRTSVRISFAFLIFFAVFIILGKAQMLLYSCVALFFHELGHAFAAILADTGIEEFRLEPFGAMFVLEHAGTNLQDGFIAFSGPAASALFAVFSIGAGAVFPQIGCSGDLATVSALIALINIVPAQPMDGGRMLHALIRGLTTQKAASKIMAVWGFFVVFLLCAVNIKISSRDHINVSLLVLSILIFFSSVKEIKNTQYAFFASSFKRRARLVKRGNIRTRLVAIHRKTRLNQAVKLLNGASVIAVLDDSMKMIGVLGEGNIAEGIGKFGADCEIERLIR